MIELTFSTKEAAPIRRRLIHYMCRKYSIEDDDFKEHYSVLDRDFEVIEFWEYLFDILWGFNTFSGER